MSNKLYRVVLIGPVKPYRGGIAHFNDCIEQELIERNYEVLTISWKLRYPAFLYPGKSQFDQDAKRLLSTEPKYLLNFYNPISWVKAIRRIQKFKPDQVIYNWVTPFLAPILFVISMFTKKRSLNTLICHNVLPHERRIVDIPLAKMVFSQMHKFIVHAELEKEKLIGIKSDANLKLGFHPKYNFFNSALIYRNIKKSYSLSTDKKVILYFGYVRSYKGLKFLIDALPQIVRQIDCHLFIVGEIWEGRESYLSQIDQLGMTDHISVIDQYIPDSDVGNFFAQSDVVVLPYLSATQSGIAQIAFAFDKPVVITNVGGLKDIGKEHPSCVLISPRDSKAIVDKTLNILKQRDTKVNPKVSSVDESLHQTWDEYIKVLVE